MANVFRSAEIAEVRSAIEGGNPSLLLKVAPYNQWTTIKSKREGNFVERVAPGAFTKTLSERGGNMPILYEHGFDPSIGIRPLGVIRSYDDQPDALWANVELFGESDAVRSILPGLREGLYGASYGGDNIKTDAVRRPTRSDFNPEGLPELTRRELAVKEVSLTLLPAYDTSATLRSLTDRFLNSDETLAIRSEPVEATRTDAASRASRIRKITLQLHNT